MSNAGATMAHTQMANAANGSSRRDEGANGGEKPYMYLSHYSTPGIVLYYLIR